MTEWDQRHLEAAMKDTGSWDKDWMMTFSGKRVFPLALKPSDVCIADIAHGTAYQCRYNGHVNRFYSVAEHCVLISAAILQATGDRGKALQGLMHDAAEAYTGDFIRPVKNSLKSVWDQWRHIEDANERVICEALNVEHPFDPIVKDYDKRIIVNEKNELFGRNKPWDWKFEPLDVVIRGWLPEYAEGMYILQFATLTNRDEHWGIYEGWLNRDAYC